MLDGVISFVRTSLPTMLSESQFVEKAYSIRGFSSKLLINLAKFDTEEVQQTSARLPLKITSREIIVKQVSISIFGISSPRSIIVTDLTRID